MLNKYFIKLNKYRNFENDENISKFEEVLGDIAALKDPNSIPKLVNYFDDKSEYPDVIFGIVHLIEEFDDHTYLQKLLPSMPLLTQKSPYWAKVLHYRIMNSPSTLDEYLKVSGSLPEGTRQALKKLLIDIKHEDKEFDTYCNNLIAKL
jgi:hypothetical protein